LITTFSRLVRERHFDIVWKTASH